MVIGVNTTVIHYNKLKAMSGVKVENLNKHKHIINKELKKGDIVVEFNGLGSPKRGKRKYYISLRPVIQFQCMG